MAEQQQQGMAFPWLQYLNQDPQLAYYSKLYGGGQNLTPMQSRHFGGNFNDIYSQYLGTQGKGLAEAAVPRDIYNSTTEKTENRGLTLAEYLNNPNSSFTDFLDEMPFAKRYAQLPPELRPGGGIGRFAPPVRWMS